jgi:hypothetical protein
MSEKSLLSDPRSEKGVEMSEKAAGRPEKERKGSKKVYNT